MPGKKERDRQYNRTRRNKASAAIYDSHWRKRFRPMFLDNHPYCARCLKEGVYEPATLVHHTIEIDEHPELAFDQDYCEALCASCHSRHHATERGKANDGKIG